MLNADLITDVKHDLFLRYIEKMPDDQLQMLHSKGEFRRYFVSAMRYEISTFSNYSHVLSTGVKKKYFKHSRFFKKYLRTYSELQNEEDYYNDFLEAFIFDNSELDFKKNEVETVNAVVKEINKLNWWDRECIYYMQSLRAQNTWQIS